MRLAPVNKLVAAENKRVHHELEATGTSAGVVLGNHQNYWPGERQVQRRKRYAQDRTSIVPTLRTKYPMTIYILRRD